MKQEDFERIILIILASIYIAITMVSSLITIKQSKQNKYDVNQDGIVNAQDYVAVKNYIMVKEK